MEGLYLRKDELEYELSIRGVDFSASDADVVQLFEEHRMEVNYVAESRLDFSHETVICGAKFTELKSLITSATSDNWDSVANRKRLLALLNHLSTRCTRYFFNAPTDLRVDSAHCVEALQGLIAEIKTKYPDADIAPLLVNDVNVEPFLQRYYRASSKEDSLNASSRPDDQQEPGSSIQHTPAGTATLPATSREETSSVSTPRPSTSGRLSSPTTGTTRTTSASVPTPVVTSSEVLIDQRPRMSGSQSDSRDLPSRVQDLSLSTRARQNPVAKWTVRFSGRKNDSVVAFLRRVEELMDAGEVTNREILSGACYLFEGPALTWYRAHRTRVNTWTELKTLLKEDFLPLKYEDDLLYEILNRKQGPQEDITLYISAMVGLYDSLSNPPSEREQLRVILRNLSPYYLAHLKISHILSIDELKTEGKELEYRRTLSQEYDKPQQRRNLLEPELSNRPPRNTVSAVSSPPEPSSARGYRPPTKCWNCGEVGHRHQLCPEMKTTFCYRCGEKGVKTINCPNCLSGNVIREH